MVDIVEGWSVYYDDPCDDVYEEGKRKGRVKRRCKEFTGSGCKGRATAFFNTFKGALNVEMVKSMWLLA